MNNFFVKIILGVVFALPSFCSVELSSADANISLLSKINQEDLIIGAGHFLADGVSINAASKERISWYKNGAVVRVSIPHKEVFFEKKFTITNLSPSIDEKSIVVRAPEPLVVTGYKLEKSDNGCFLCLTVKEVGTVQDNDLWQLQYATKDVSWSTNHLVELSSDKGSITLTTTIRIDNQSGINFSNAQIQFFDCDIPQDESNKNLDTPASTYIEPSVVYRHHIEGDVGPGKVIVWSTAKRIVVSSSNGLFVGGPYLKKMNETAYPKIENWITFPNTIDVGLGKALPSGRVSVYHNREGFSSLIGFSTMHQVKGGGDVTIRMPSFVQGSPSRTPEAEAEYSPLDAQLIQENYRVLAPTVSEAEYRLVLKNSNSTSVSLKVTIDSSQSTTYSVARSSINYEKDKKGDVFWLFEIPPRGSRELRYRLTLRTLNAAN
ncbi:MAG: DUF4139 domain-containing protein [Holosporales bacterium]|jgi:hypothetical protein|nr:DUF4139 domain-containing protein [Holosporales bacterium]